MFTSVDEREPGTGYCVDELIEIIEDMAHACASVRDVGSDGLGADTSGQTRMNPSF